MKLALAVLAAIALVAFPGCGDDEPEPLTREEYAEEVSDIVDPLGGEVEDAVDALREAESVDDVAAALDDLEAQITGKVEQLEELVPPSEAEGLNGSLIEALQTFGDVVTAASDAASSGEVSAIVTAATELPGAVEELEDRLRELRRELEDLGIEVSPQ